MNPLDIEIARFMQNAKLAYFTKETQESEPQFAFDYYKRQAFRQLSPKAKGRLTQDLNTKNIKSFSKSYQAAEKVIASALMVRYISTTLTISERLNTFATKLEKSKMKVVRQQPIITDCRQLLNEYRFGLILISDENEFE